MTSRNLQPKSAPVEQPEHDRLRQAELLTRLIAVCVGVLACVTQAMLRSEGFSLAEKAGLRLAAAALAPVIRELETLAAEYRKLPDPDGQTSRATIGAASDEAPVLARAAPPAPHQAALASAPGGLPPGLLPWPPVLIRPRAGPSPPPVLAAKAAAPRASTHVHIVPMS